MTGDSWGTHIGTMKYQVILILVMMGVNFGRQAKEGDKDVNYDEAKVPTYDLPELLVTVEGKRITTPEEWYALRRPQIMSLFSNLVYGRVPEPSDEWVARNEIQNPDGLEGNRWIVDYEGNYYWLKTILDEKDDPAMMPASFQEAIMPLRKTGETYRVIWRKGGKRPQLVTAGSLIASSLEEPRTTSLVGGIKMGSSLGALPSRSWLRRRAAR